MGFGSGSVRVPFSINVGANSWGLGPVRSGFRFQLMKGQINGARVRVPFLEAGGKFLGLGRVSRVRSGQDVRTVSRKSLKSIRDVDE